MSHPVRHPARQITSRTDPHFDCNATGRMPLRQPPALRDGVEKRVIHRVYRETREMAMARARRMPWYARRINREPYSDARNWIWHVRVR